MLRDKFILLTSHGLFVRLFLVPMTWLIAISVLHYHINFESTDRPILRMGYMPVITNLAAPILDYATKKGDGVRYQAIKYASFSEMAESIRNDQLDIAFMIAPLSVVLRQQGSDVKIIYIGNRHESTLVTQADLKIHEFSQLAGKTVAVPMRFSGHNLSMLELAERFGLDGSVNIVEMNPPDMASAMASGSLDAYYVGEPFAAKAVKAGHASVLSLVEDVWPGFICNLVIVKNSLIESKPQMVQDFVNAAVRSGLWAERNLFEAASIASRYWNQDIELVNYALTTPPGRIVFDRFLPVEEEMQQFADLMVKHGLLEDNNIGGLVEPRFAAQANVKHISTLESVISPP